MFKIYLSPSTQEHNVGVADYGTEESRMNQIADVVQRELERVGGFEIHRNCPEMTLNQVILDSNAIKPDAHVAIHSNASVPTARGVLGLFWKQGTTSYNLCSYIHDEICALGEPDNGMRPGNGLAETDRVNAPSCIIEVAFHTNMEDEQFIVNNIEAIGIAITKGICKYAGITYVEEEKDMPRERLTCDQILDKKTTNPQGWKDFISCIKSIAPFNIGALKIGSWIETLIENIYND